MHVRFNSNEFIDLMLELVGLKQTNTVEKYYDEFESLLNLLQLPNDYALRIFISNLKHELPKLIQLFFPQSLTYALNLSKQLEYLIFNTPRKSYIPYKNPQSLSTNQNFQQPPPKLELPLLLPIPGGTFLNPQPLRYVNTNPNLKHQNDNLDMFNSKLSKASTKEESDEGKRK